MTEQERDAAVLGADGAVDDEAVDDAALAEDAFEDEGTGATEAPVAAASATAAGTQRKRGTPKAAPVAPSVSEQAVRVDDRASAWFVMALVALFAIVFANALLLGHGGLVSNIFPSPTPAVTAAPTAKPTAVPTAKPTASPTAVPSASATPAPTVAPTAAPTPTAKAS